MQAYNKLWIALVGAIVQGLVVTGVIEQNEASKFAEAAYPVGTALLTAVAVWAIPNKYPPGTK